MKSRLMGAAWIALACSTCGTISYAQLRDNSEKQMTCDNGSRNGDRARHCEIREQTVASLGRLNIDPGQNGGVTIKGSLRGDVLVRSRVEASADTEAAAATLASRVSVDVSGGQVKANGPETADNSYWSVSYEIFVPQNTDLAVKAHNGGISLSDVRGQLHFETQNGGVSLRRVAGDVSGSTVNGGVSVELTGAIWEGRQMEVSTQNGGVTLKVPSYYSAHLQAETVNGGIHSDFAVATDEKRPKKVDMNVGSGGPLLHFTTQNGGVSVTKIAAQ